ncbi:cellobiose phosphorylase [Desemzia sp. C1]|uniref:GH36-type glycosyl hydrolase domain-containing protein n=1 Tax=Desemzia sp. C1 TaxID=2892016 RepID=UPI001E4EA4EA|nr:cellobiose phosphorylase [Desemzia sp. C1]MCI3027968.1 cellobiose phosphorylase [Desemzia sp. C1]
MHEIKRDKQQLLTIQSEGLVFRFLKTGDIYDIQKDSVMINQLTGNPLDGSLNNLYLRIYQDSGEITYHPLLGIESVSEFLIGEKQARWTGNVEGVTYQVLFTLADKNSWFWKVHLSGNQQKIDVVYGQDVGLASKGALQSNEAYVAQYVDHQVFEDAERGFVICSRQNQPQADQFPYLQQGSLTGTVGYSTDGFQFFGETYKETNQPAVLTQERLANEVYQFEFDYTGLQSTSIQLDGEADFIFYGIYKDSHPEAVTNLEYQEEITTLWEKQQEEQDFKAIKKLHKNKNIGEPLETVYLEKKAVKELYPNRLQEEYDGTELLSFFTDTYEHVVLKEKELQMERPHGQLLFTENSMIPKDSIISTTSWMYGIFNAQLVMGNTNMNKWNTNARNPLNILKTSGQRIYVEVAGKYRLLAMPSLFEIGINSVKWLYKTAEETFIVTNYSSADNPEIRLTVTVQSGKKYRFLVTQQVVLGETEYETSVLMNAQGQQLSFTAGDSSPMSNYYPQLVYHLKVNGPEIKVLDESFFIEGIDAGSASLAVLQLEDTDQFELVMQGSLEGDSYQEHETTLEKEQATFHAFFKQVTNGFHLSNPNSSSLLLEKLNVTVWWYTHNMFVHYLVPHGLEQYGGAAWGTRDVSQGPAEYFMAMQQYDSVKEILTILYAHQHEEDGNWPQWFMFDRYREQQADESHGDIIVWPLKILSDYLVTTGDVQLLDVELPYMEATGKFTEETFSLFDHVKKEIQYIQNHFLWDTHLSSYGDGDWDDTLQPHDQTLKKQMASSWTVALTYQTLKQFEKAIKERYPVEAEELDTLAAAIKKDYQEYILTDEVIPGFVYMPDKEQVEFMIHPQDQKTGIQYRLLPMIQSMTSEIFTPEQAQSHYQLIKSELQHPDGVRLMNRPASYKGGISTHFKRAEQAANFGREIGLQYVHAHIRFVEAMAKIGQAEEVWNGLEVVNPINIQEVVLNAKRRQSNAYFSSSDGAFNTRYEAQKNFDLLKTGDVQVKGGWRIYSSGPGIYLNQLISNSLGIRVEKNRLLIDPILTEDLDGLILDFAYAGVPVQFMFQFVGKETDDILWNNQKIKGSREQNPYRKGGLVFQKEEIEQVIQKEENKVTIFLTKR